MLLEILAAISREPSPSLFWQETGPFMRKVEGFLCKSSSTSLFGSATCYFQPEAFIYLPTILNCIIFFPKQLLLLCSDSLTIILCKNYLCLRNNGVQFLIKGITAFLYAGLSTCSCK